METSSNVTDSTSVVTTLHCCAPEGVLDASISSVVQAGGTQPPPLSSNALLTCWENALEIYNSEQKPNDERIINIDCPASHPTCSIQELLKATINAKTECDAKRTAFQQKLEAIVSTLQQYSPVVDIFILQQSNITAVVWGALRFLIGVAAKKTETSEQIEDALVEIVICLDRWEKNVLNHSQAYGTLRTSTLLFAEIIKFLVIARIHYRTRYAVQFLRAGFCPLKADIDRILSLMRKYSEIQHKEGFSTFVTENAEFRSIQIDHFEYQQSQNEEQGKFREESRAHQRHVVEMFHILPEMKQLMAEQEQRQQASHAIRLLEPARKVPIFVPQSTDGTCHWIFEHQSFKNWLDSGCRQVLWIKGIPGCGKTCMAAFLRDRTIASEVTLAYFSSISGDKGSSDAKSLAVFILLQLLNRERAAPKPEHRNSIKTITDFCQPFDDISQCPFSLLRSTLSTALEFMPGFTLIIDALDEFSDPENVKHLVEDLQRVCKSPEAKVIITSRNHTKFDGLITGGAVITMDVNAVTPDIHLFISTKIRERPSLNPIEKKIHDKARQACHGMFLWASTMIEYLATTARTEKEQLWRLEQIPAGLANFFEQLMSQSGKKMNRNDLQLRRQILLLLLSASRELTIPELTVALQLRNDGRQRKDEQLTDVKGTVLELCWPVVSIFGDYVKFVHRSVVDFLLEPEKKKTAKVISVHMTREDSNATLAQKCLNILSQEEFRSPNRMSYWLYRNVYPEHTTGSNNDGTQAEAFRDTDFYEYAARYWAVHLTAVPNPSRELLDLANTFLHGYEFVTWAEYLYHLKGDIGPIVGVYGDLKSWHVSIPIDSRKYVVVDDFFSNPYRTLSDFYSQEGEDKLLPYLCLYRLGDFYTAEADLEGEYEIKKRVVDGLEVMLGKKNPLTLRASAAMGFCYIVAGQLHEALKLYLELSKTQRETIGTDKSDYFESLQQVAFVQFLMTDFTAAAVTQGEVSAGLESTLGQNHTLFLTSQIFNGEFQEALGFLDGALGLYKRVYDKRSKTLGQDNPLALYAQSSMASIYRKQGDYETALTNLDYAFQIRQQLLGLYNFLVVDTVIQLIILYREMGHLDDANARIDLVSQPGILDDRSERYCQVNHLRALVRLDEGEHESARRILQALLDEQAQRGREANNRSLLWVRLTLATILREHDDTGADPELLFDNIVTPLQDAGAQYVQLQTLEELRIAEKALRLVRERKVKDAETLLEENGLRWVRKEDFWLFEGGPPADTAWMKGP